MSESARIFNRLPSVDPRNNEFPIRTLVAGKTPRSYTWRYIQLDQGSEGACTGFAVTMEAGARPHPVFGDPVKANIDYVNANSTGFAVYHRARQLDEYPGEDYEGSSVLGAMKAGVERGWYGGYRWATGNPDVQAADVILAIGYKGPVIIGSNWYEGMFRSDTDGFLRPTGRIAGGHAFILSAYSKKRDAVFVPNSWGGDGQGWIKRQDLARLLSEQGDACIPVDRKG